MTKDLKIIQAKLINILKSHLGVLQVSVDKPTSFEVKGTIEAPQGKQILDGIYFSTIKPKDKDVRFYFYPSYTHPDAFLDLSEALLKMKKGKSCYYIKYLDDELEKEIKNVVAKAVKLYQKDGLLAKK